MKKYTFLMLAFVNSYFIFSQDSFKDAKKFNLFTTRDLTVDLKFIDPDKGSFGIDYKFALERKLFKLYEGSNLNLNLNSNGFVTVAGDENQNNSIISELKFEGFPLFCIPAETNLDIDRDWDDVDDEAKLIEDASRLAAELSSPLWVFLDVHAKHEATQDFKQFDYALGGTLSVTSSYLSAIMDYPFGLLRADDHNYPRQLDISVGYDYVLGLDNTTYVADGGLENINRLNFRAEWETGILTPRDRISFLFDSYYDLDATHVMKDSNEEWKTFYMIKIDHAISYNDDTKTLTKISIKYTEGELPPNFVKGYVIGGGLSIEF